jgi:hypothetical protein
VILKPLISLRDSPLIQAYGGCLILFTTIFVTIQFKPYSLNLLYILEVIGNSTNALVLLTGLLFIAGADDSKIDVRVLSNFLIAICIGVFAMYVACIVFAAVPKFNWILTELVCWYF